MLEDARRDYTAHTPVLLHAALGLLSLRRGQTALDGTAGSGAMTAALADAVGPEGRVIALDRDPEAVSHCRERFAQVPQVTVVRADFRRLAEVWDELGSPSVHGALFDLGVSTHQLADGAGRGFSFLHDEPLDMRMDPSLPESAADLLARLPEAELVDLLRRLGEELHARRIAQAIAQARGDARIGATRRLAEIVEKAMPGGRPQRIHPATRTFMALRIAVNDELGALEAMLGASVDVLAPRGRIAVISYHSLEDRMVKRFFAEAERDCVCPPRQPVCTCDKVAQLRRVTRRAVRPGEEEVARNPRARSARLRCAERPAPQGPLSDSGESDDATDAERNGSV